MNPNFKQDIWREDPPETDDLRIQLRVQRTVLRYALRAVLPTKDTKFPPNPFHSSISPGCEGLAVSPSDLVFEIRACLIEWTGERGSSAGLFTPVIWQRSSNRDRNQLPPGKPQESCASKCYQVKLWQKCVLRR